MAMVMEFRRMVVIIIPLKRGVCMERRRKTDRDTDREIVQISILWEVAILALVLKGGQLITVNSIVIAQLLTGMAHINNQTHKLMEVCISPPSLLWFMFTSIGRSRGQAEGGEDVRSWMYCCRIHSAFQLRDLFIFRLANKILTVVAAHVNCIPVACFNHLRTP